MQSSDSVIGRDPDPEAIRGRQGQLAPFEWYAEMRRDAPVHFDEQRETWDVFRYEDVKRVLKDHDAFTAKRTVTDGEPSNAAEGDEPMLQTMITTDPPEHTRLRGFANERFQPGSIRDYQPRVEEMTEEVLDEIEGEDQFDFVEAFSVPLPVTVIAELLGIPAERRDQFKAWSDALIARPEDETREAAQRIQQQRQRAQREMGGYFAKLLEERQGDDGDDLVTLAANADGLTKQEQIGFCILLLLAGNITTTNLLTNALWTFEEEGITDAVRRGEIDRGQAIEEVLRYRSPIQSLKRVAVEDVELGGRQIEAGDAVTLWLGSANRDPEMFEAPEEFRPERSPNRHVAFGDGIHYCLGAPLARMEADVAVKGLLDQCDRIDADLSSLKPLESLYGLESLPCDVTQST